MCSTPRMSLGGWNSPSQREHALGDVLGEIADPLQIVGDAQRADDLAQVDRHRLPARDGQHGLFLDLALQRVDRRVGADDALRQLGIASRQRIDRVGDLLFGKPAHLGNHAGELLQVDIEGLGGMFVHHARHPCRRVRSAEAAGDVVLGAPVVRRREDLRWSNRTRSTRRDT